jgi:hypothetical protein
MAVYPPGFSERVFEFSFNAQYAAANRAVLAGVPDIPSQNDEKWLGYDVAYSIQAAGGAVNTLALQHKTARYVDNASGTNWQFTTVVGLPYFAFRLDVDQFNIIQSVASAAMLGIEFYFCAPLFVNRMNMNKHYMGQTVLANSLWIDVAGASELDNDEPHSLIYRADGTVACVFSDEPRRVKVVRPREGRQATHDQRKLDDDDYRKIYDVTFNAIRDYWPRRRKTRRAAESEVPPMPDQLPAYQHAAKAPENFRALRDLLCTYLGVSLLVELP